MTEREEIAVHYGHRLWIFMDPLRGRMPLRRDTNSLLNAKSLLMLCLFVIRQVCYSSKFQEASSENFELHLVICIIQCKFRSKSKPILKQILHSCDLG
ncbi:hypothetical protein NPIL_26051 [Nephila pilipes]|uniref:Uncharacterized protein n=1 Tax=Nephila pilipes TaxID=299642 RepID=A0A8X6P8J1_NEPPI|nr:hypothetical protein NPIL_26051 [Nephila pilipes]